MLQAWLAKHAARLALYGLLVAIVASGGAYLSWSALSGRTEAAEAREAQARAVAEGVALKNKELAQALTKTREIAEWREKQRRDALRQKEAADARTEAALAANSEWAGTPVPSDVLDSLREPR